MYKVKIYNSIKSNALEKLDGNKYTISADIEKIKRVWDAVKETLYN